MADSEPFLSGVLEGERPVTGLGANRRAVSVDVFRGFSVCLMILVDYAGSIFPIIAHCPWNGLHLAEFVMPFFLFISGISVALAYGKASDRVFATWKAMLRAIKLFLLGVLLQGGYFHGITSLTYGVDLKRVRWLGILQRISIGYVVAALCEIWLSCWNSGTRSLLRSYWRQWVVAVLLSGTYLGLSYFLYVPDWQYRVSKETSLPSSSESDVYIVKCGLRGDVGPACNPAGMIDRFFLGIDHLYTKPFFRNLKECSSMDATLPSWCDAPFDPEGILSSLMAAVVCIIGLEYGHVLAHKADHKERLCNWCVISSLLFVLGVFLSLVGIPINKSLYTISYMSITTAFAGITFCGLYILVDVYGWRRVVYPLEWAGAHSLAIFILFPSNLVPMAAQGLYWNAPHHNVVSPLPEQWVCIYGRDWVGVYGSAGALDCRSFGSKMTPTYGGGGLQCLLGSHFDLFVSNWTVCMVNMHNS